MLTDRSGRSSGKAVVKFIHKSDGFKAIKEFDRAELDGRKLTVEWDK